MAEHLKVMNKRMVLLNPKFVNRQSKTSSPQKMEDAKESNPYQQEEIENEAKLYDALREKMSTKEFLEQYDKGITHD